MTEYEQQARDFCAKHGVIVEVEYQYAGPYFPSDKDENIKRDVYRFTVKTQRGAHSGVFGNSLYNTNRRVFALARAGTFISDASYPLAKEAKRLGFKVVNGDHGHMLNGEELLAARQAKPTEYDILACLTKSDPGTFDDFCADYGYDTDSRRAEQTYFEVQKEWAGIRRLFDDEQLEELREIS